MIQFDSDSFYEEDSLRVLGLDAEVLAEARRNDLLRFLQVGRVRMYKGEWLQEWLAHAEQDDSQRRARHRA